MTLHSEEAVRTHRVSLAPDAKLAHLNRKPNACHSAKKRKSLPSHGDTLQPHSKEAYNLSGNCECGTAVISPSTWEQGDGSAQIRAATHERSSYWSACVRKLTEAKVITLYCSQIVWELAAIFQPNIWLSSHCALLTVWSLSDEWISFPIRELND